MAKAPQKRKFIDWDSIEPLYRAGAIPLSEICVQYEADHINSTVWKKTVTYPAIIKRAKEKKWKKNLSNHVVERVREKLVTGPVTGHNQTDEQIIESASDTAVAVAQAQRDRISRLLEIQDDLANDLKDATLENADIMAKIRGFKDISITVRNLQDQQAERYNFSQQALNPNTQDTEWTIKVVDNA